MKIRDARPDEFGEIYHLCKELAEYEKLSHEMTATLAEYQALFGGENPRAFALVAEVEGGIVGCAVWHYNVSTFLGKLGIYLEDLYVQPEARGRGIGNAFFEALKEKAKQEGLGRIVWQVLDWNEPSIKFYESLGATCRDGWLTYLIEV